MESGYGEGYSDGYERAGKKYSATEWLMSEQPVSDQEQKVIDILKKLGNDGEYYEINGMKVMGDFMFISLIEEIDVPSIFDETMKSIMCILPSEYTYKIIKYKKKDQMKFDNAIEHRKNEIIQIRESFVKKSKSDLKFLSNVIEIRGIWFLYATTKMITKKDEYLTYEKIDKAFSLISATQKFINSCKGEKTYPSVVNGELMLISNYLIMSLQHNLEKLAVIFSYNGFVINDYAPSVLVYTEYDSAIPSRTIRPREHQEELVIKTKQNMKNGFFIVYRAMIGSGKTFGTIALASMIDKLRMEGKYHDLQLIFCCNLKSVKDQVANLCYNGRIKFGILSFNIEKNELELKKHNICRSIDDIVVIISSPDSVYKLLCKNIVERKQYMLFLDEPTIGADKKGDIEHMNELKMNMLVVSVAPKWTILSSATFPSIKKILDITEKFKLKYQDAFVGEICSNDIQIGCDILTYDNQQYAPFIGSKTKKQLEDAMNRVVKCPFLGRTYTMKICKYLWKKMKKMNISNVPEMEELFCDIDKMGTNGIKNTIERLLTILICQSDEIIEEVCKSIIDEKEELKLKSLKQEKSNDDIFEVEEKEYKPILPEPIRFNAIGTTLAYKFLGMTLIATEEPCKFVLDNLMAIVEDIYNSTTSYGDTYRSTANALAIYEQHKEIYDRTVETTKNYKTTKKAEFDIGNKEMTKHIMELVVNDIPKPKFPFPDFGHINSLEHLTKYNPLFVTQIPKRLLRIKIRTISEEVQRKTPDNILTMLYAGIGIYTDKNVGLPFEYFNEVQRLAQNGDLAFLVADSSICYGTNFPLNRVIITDDFAENHSINTLFQVMGRAGRVGKSWFAETYVSRTTLELIMNYSEDNVELKNIRNMTEYLEK